MIDISVANFITVGLMALIFEALWRMVAAALTGAKGGERRKAARA